MDTKQARSWLAENGYHVKPKGRIPAELLAIYQAKVLKKNAASVAPAGPVPGDDDSDGDRDDLQSPGKRKKVKKRGSCGFCSINAAYKHQRCPETINQGKMGVWVCFCYEKGHTL
jgi:hypothetical protein